MMKKQRRQEGEEEEVKQGGVKGLPDLFLHSMS